MRLIDADALMNYCLNQKIKTIGCNDIARFPTVEAKPTIHARWEGVNPMIDTIECSYCGYQEQSIELATPYCGWCGAIMDNFEMGEEI